MTEADARHRLRRDSRYTMGLDGSKSNNTSSAS